MDYFLYKLKFDGAVHIGQSESALSLYTTADHFRADTFFSALCHTALSLWGERGAQDLIESARRTAAQRQYAVAGRPVLPA